MATNPASILDSVKKVIGFEADYTAFDIDITMQINMAFGVLRQLGVGAETGFIIQDNTTLWVQYVSDIRLLSLVQTYIFMVVKLAFDPPATSFTIDALRRQIEELAFRINVAAEELNPPVPPATEVCEEPEGPIESGIFKTFFAPKIVQLESSGPEVNMNAQDGNVFYLTLARDTLIQAPVNGTEAQHISLELKTAGFSVTWGNGWNFGDAGLPQLSADKVNIIAAVYDTFSSEWFCGYVTGF